MKPYHVLCESIAAGDRGDRLRRGRVDSESAHRGAEEGGGVKEDGTRSPRQATAAAEAEAMSPDGMWRRRGAGG